MGRYFDDYGFRIRMDKAGEGGAGGGGTGGGSGGTGGGGGAGAGGGSGGDRGTDDARRGRRRQKERQRTPIPLTELAIRAQTLINAHGSPENAVAYLYRDNKQLRDQIRDGQLAEGHVQLDATDAKEWAEFRALGKPAKELKTLLEEHPTLVKFKSDRERTDRHREAARLLEWDPDVLVDLTNARGLEVVVEDENVKDGDKTVVRKVAYVKPEGDAKAKKTPLAEYATANFQPYMTALKAKGGNGAPRAGENGFPRQSAADQGSGGSIVDKHLERVKKQGASVVNPLSPQPAKSST